MEKQRKGNRKAIVAIGGIVIAALAVLCLCLGLGVGTGKAEEFKTQPVKTVAASTFATVTFDGTETEYDNFAAAWNAATTAATTESDQATVKMYKDVTAVDGSFGTASKYLLMENDYLTLDLNGCKLDRALTGRIPDGSVIKGINGGHLTLDDTSEAQTGKVTGGNSTDKGGGLAFPDETHAFSFTMNGGSIMNNNSNSSGGGVYNDGTLFLSGSVTRNTGGGVYQNGKMYVTGESYVTDNTMAGEPQNVILPDGKKVSFDGNINATAASAIGITTLTKPTDAASITVTDGSANKVTFSSDDSNYVIVTKGGHIAVAVPASLILGDSNNIDKTYDGKEESISSVATHGDADVEYQWYKVVGGQRRRSGKRRRSCDSGCYDFEYHFFKLQRKRRLLLRSQGV